MGAEEEVLRNARVHNRAITFSKDRRTGAKWLVTLIKYAVCLRIRNWSPGGALFVGTCIHNFGTCNGILYKE